MEGGGGATLGNLLVHVDESEDATASLAVTLALARAQQATLTGLYEISGLEPLLSQFLLKLAFTCLPVIPALSDSRPVGLGNGVAVVAVGLALFVILELEKLGRRRFMARERFGRGLPGRAGRQV
ncbi:MAG: hypothetical protein KDJ41_07675 [Hyphomicrobiaceae bacterium]|nr:hypothetical protein [Hyphomicrobiaceae bacterium]